MGIGKPLLESAWISEDRYDLRVAFSFLFFFVVLFIFLRLYRPKGSSQLNMTKPNSTLFSTIIKALFYVISVHRKLHIKNLIFRTLAAVERSIAITYTVLNS